MVLAIDGILAVEDFTAIKVGVWLRIRALVRISVWI